MTRTRRDVVRVPTNNTVKLSDPLRLRVAQAMQANGFTVWAEFCRVALTVKCQVTEKTLIVSDPAEYARIYGRRSAGSN